MNSNDEAPKLPFWPFILADAALLGAAFYLGSRTSAPLGTTIVVVIGVLVVVGAFLATVPFVLSYTRRQDETLTERQREISALAQSTASSAEQISIAASSLHGIAENAAKSARLAETLPAKLQEKIHEFKERLNEVSLTENESLSQEVNSLRASETERIEAAVATMRKLTQDFTQLEAMSRKNLAELNEAMTQFTAKLASAAAAATKLASATAADTAPQATAAPPVTASAATVAGPSAPVTATAPAIASAPVAASAPAVSAPVAATVAATSPAPTSVSTTAVSTAATTAPTTSPETAAEPAETPETEKVPARRPARKTPTADELGLGLDAEPDEPAALSSDGITRLLVTAYIGIGNKLFIRGDGPGLSWDRGTPLQFVSIGKWRWETGEAAGPVHLKLFKNDAVECTSLGEVELEAGHQLQVTANFQ
ncbi:MAG TPA: hypothetical protein VFT72_00935 [Opitutaceae bacterium]|nr:hypothetical protein [Opitutaceae bacterium]